MEVKIKPLILLLAACVSCVVSAAPPPPLGVTTRGKCVHVVDGDTIDVEVRYVVRVRLLDCWADENNTPSGRSATQNLTNYAEGKPVIWHVPTQFARSMLDILTLGRVLGHVWVDGDSESISERQVRLGLAATSKGAPLGK